MLRVILIRIGGLEINQKINYFFVFLPYEVIIRCLNELENLNVVMIISVEITKHSSTILNKEKRLITSN
jgi:hypothetical protein